MLRRTPMKRTGWARPPYRVDDKSQKPAQAHVECAHSAIKPVAKSRAIMAPIGDFGPTPCPKEPKPMRDRKYRELVAGLECFNCGVHKHSQAAHPNSGKAKGVKKCDSRIFPMCTVGARDCHGRFDRYELVSRADMPDFERRAYFWTVRTLIARGLWPMRLAIPDLRSFDA